MEEKETYKTDPDKWWRIFWKEAAKQLQCDNCPFQMECQTTKPCGIVLANKFLEDYAGGGYEF